MLSTGPGLSADPVQMHLSADPVHYALGCGSLKPAMFLLYVVLDRLRGGACIFLRDGGRGRMPGRHHHARAGLGPQPLLGPAADGAEANESPAGQFKAAS